MSLSPGMYLAVIFIFLEGCLMLKAAYLIVEYHLGRPGSISALCLSGATALFLFWFANALFRGKICF